MVFLLYRMSFVLDILQRSFTFHCSASLSQAHTLSTIPFHQSLGYLAYASFTEQFEFFDLCDKIRDVLVANRFRCHEFVYLLSAFHEFSWEKQRNKNGQYCESKKCEQIDLCVSTCKWS